MVLSGFFCFIICSSVGVVWIQAWIALSWTCLSSLASFSTYVQVWRAGVQLRRGWRHTTAGTSRSCSAEVFAFSKKITGKPRHGAMHSALSTGSAVQTTSGPQNHEQERFSQTKTCFLAREKPVFDGL